MYKFEVGELVQMIMGRACYAHFDGALAKITKQDGRVTPYGFFERYRMNPIDSTLQQNVCFNVGYLRKLKPLEPLLEIHINQISISERFIPQKIEKLDRRLKEQLDIQLELF